MPSPDAIYTLPLFLFSNGIYENKRKAATNIHNQMKMDIFVYPFAYLQPVSARPEDERREIPARLHLLKNCRSLTMGQEWIYFYRK